MDPASQILRGRWPGIAMLRRGKLLGFGNFVAPGAPAAQAEAEPLPHGQVSSSILHPPSSPHLRPRRIVPTFRLDGGQFAMTLSKKPYFPRIFDADGIGKAAIFSDSAYFFGKKPCLKLIF